MASWSVSCSAGTGVWPSDFQNTDLKADRRVGEPWSLGTGGTWKCFLVLQVIAEVFADLEFCGTVCLTVGYIPEVLPLPVKFLECSKMECESFARNPGQAAFYSLFENQTLVWGFGIIRFGVLVLPLVS